ncbi:MAG: biotin synthase, partial [Betaproteobacteria bacterium]|nr:biotin synthase [Betaproteobacteria bacterium]
GGHLHPNRAKGLRSRVWLAKLEAALEVLRQADGLYRLEIELIFGHAWRSPDRPKAEAWQPIELRPKSA